MACQRSANGHQIEDKGWWDLRGERENERNENERKENETKISPFIYRSKEQRHEALWCMCPVLACAATFRVKSCLHLEPTRACHRGSFHLCPVQDLRPFETVRIENSIVPICWRVNPKKVSTPRGTDVLSPLAWFFFCRLWETLHYKFTLCIVLMWRNTSDGNPSYDGFTIMIKVILVIESNG